MCLNLYLLNYFLGILQLISPFSCQDSTYTCILTRSRGFAFKQSWICGYEKQYSVVEGVEVTTV